MFAYCNNNPVNAYDYSGESACAIAGGALAGALISAVSYLIACGLNNDDVTLGGLLKSALVGATTGAIGVYAGAATVLSEALKFCGLAGTISALFTDGEWYVKLLSGVISAAGTFAGTYIPTNVSGKFAEMFANYAATLFSGVPTEMISVSMQQFLDADNQQVIYPDITTLSNPNARIFPLASKGSGGTSSRCMIAFSY